MKKYSIAVLLLLFSLLASLKINASCTGQKACGMADCVINMHGSSTERDWTWSGDDCTERTGQDTSKPKGNYQLAGGYNCSHYESDATGHCDVYQNDKCAAVQVSADCPPRKSN